VEAARLVLYDPENPRRNALYPMSLSARIRAFKVSQE
jgi:hypothetical protein